MLGTPQSTCTIHGTQLRQQPAYLPCAVFPWPWEASLPTASGSSCRSRRPRPVHVAVNDGTLARVLAADARAGLGGGPYHASSRAVRFLKPRIDPRTCTQAGVYLRPRSRMRQGSRSPPAPYGPRADSNSAALSTSRPRMRQRPRLWRSEQCWWTTAAAK
eukprot:352114-Chlamydomonas_euryale.AAC.3